MHRAAVSCACAALRPTRRVGVLASSHATCRAHLPLRGGPPVGFVRLLAKAARPRRVLPPSIIVAETASARLADLLAASPGSAGLRVGMTNDWGSHTGFSYTMGFVAEADIDKTDEQIELPNGVRLFVERKAIWVGEGGLLGAVLDLDADYNLIITPKEKPPE